MRLPFGLADRTHHDRRLLHIRIALVRGRHGLVHQPRQVLDEGVRVLGSGREATVLGNQVDCEVDECDQVTCSFSSLSFLLL